MSEQESTLGRRITWRPGQVLIFESQCDVCIHKQKGLNCDAFPSGIPYAIWRNDVDHREPYQGDNGIMFEATT